MTTQTAKNLCILITADTFRYDHLEEGLAPNIKELQQGGISFEKAFSTGSGTSSAFPGILASSYPLDHGYRGLNENHTAVAQQLAAKGIRSVGVTSSSHASSLFNYDRGFDTFHEDVSYREDAVNSLPVSEVMYHRLKQLAMKTSVTRRIGSTVLEFFRKAGYGTFQYAYQRAEVVTDNAISAIDQAVSEDGPLFVWIHYMEPHSPYYPPDEILEKHYSGGYSKAEVNKILTNWYENREPLWTDDAGTYTLDSDEIDVLKSFYRAQIAYLDRELGRLFDWLRERNLYTDSLTMFTSDHGEEFFDHGDFGHRQKLYNELIHIPFVINDGGERRSTGALVSHVDIGPTICDWFGIEAAPSWRGETLLPIVRGQQDCLQREYVLSELCHRSAHDGYGGDVVPEEMIIAVMTNDWKLIYNKQSGTTELFELDDPETAVNDRLEKDDPVAEELLDIVQQREGTITATTLDRQELSEEVRTRLHELGYVGE